MVPFVGETMSMLSPVVSYFGQKEANQTNKEIADQATQTNAEQAAINRNFQRQMSNTAHQRQVEDLKKAGINPLLAAGQSGASSPSGSTATAETAHMENTMQGLSSGVAQAISSGIALRKQGTELGLLEDQRNLTKAQTGKAAMDTQVQSKELPRADAYNRIYKWANSLFENAKATNVKRKDVYQRMDDAAGKVLKNPPKFKANFY